MQTCQCAHIHNIGLHYFEQRRLYENISLNARIKYNDVHILF